MTTTPTDPTPTALVIGASRGLGHAISAELHARGWEVVGTVRDPDVHTDLHDLADDSGGRVGIEQLDITEPDQLEPLHDRLAQRLAGRTLDLLLVNAGTTRDADLPIGEVPTDHFVDVMVTNALSPVRAMEHLDDLVSPTGTIAAMTSGQGSITRNVEGGRELYRGSKAALNMYVRGYAVRQHASEQGAGRAVLLLAPGWIQTELGGPGATSTLAEATPEVVDVLTSRAGRPGLVYLDRSGATVPW